MEPGDDAVFVGDDDAHIDDDDLNDVLMLALDNNPPCIFQHLNNREI